MVWATLSATNAGIFLVVTTGLEALALGILFRRQREPDGEVALVMCLSILVGVAGALGAFWG